MGGERAGAPQQEPPQVPAHDPSQPGFGLPTGDHQPLIDAQLTSPGPQDTAGIAERFGSRLIDLTILGALVGLLAQVPALAWVPGWGLALYLLYELLPARLQGRSPGKWVMRLAIRSETGGRLQLRQLLTRAALLPLGMLAGIVVLTLSSREGGGGSVPAMRLPHDVISGTRVVTLLAGRGAPRWVPLAMLVSFMVALFGALFVAIAVSERSDAERYARASACRGADMGNPTICYIDTAGTITHIDDPANSSNRDVQVTALSINFDAEVARTPASEALVAGEPVQVRVWGSHLVWLEANDQRFDGHAFFDSAPFLIAGLVTIAIALGFGAFCVRLVMRR
jgi:uncharacterized RDD family membrane protein YckC